MKISIKYFEKKFKNITAKEAYLDACKWVAVNVMNNKTVSKDTTWKMEKVEDADSPTIILSLFATLEEEEARESACDRCREFHKSFFINEDYNCNSCKMTAYYKNLEHKLDIKKNYKIQKLTYILEK